ncbi:hypothetical protein RI367_003998 [Sorochytrium milnesiophthora]
MSANQTAPASRLRWLILLLSCTVMFGNYFAFDQVASLNIPLEEYMALESKEEFNYFINSVYVVYSLPNVVLPFIGGALLDRYGVRTLTIVFGALVLGGQFVFAAALEGKSIVGALFGRFLFGLGGETLSVAQQRITTKWFFGNELALAVGINLSVARLGSVLNDFVSPHLAHNSSIPTALWFGFVTCLLSYMCTLMMVVIDRRYEHFSPEVVMMADLQPGRDEWTPLPGGDMSEGGRHRTSPRRRPPNLSLSQQQGIRAMLVVEWVRLRAGILSFPLIFWLGQLIMVLLYGTVVPFNAIHSEFLMLRWYPTDAKKAAQVMGVPDLLSAVLVPFVGTYADRHGHRGRQILICAAIVGFVHAILAHTDSTTLGSPVPLLMILGSSYALLLTFMPCIPLIVSEGFLGTAYGISTSLANLSWSVFPLVVASLSTQDPTFTLTESFFSLCGFLGVVFSAAVMYLDYTRHGSILDRPIAKYAAASDEHTKLGQALNNVLSAASLVVDENDDDDDDGDKDLEYNDDGDGADDHTSATALHGPGSSPRRKHKSPDADRLSLQLDRRPPF